MKKQDYDRLTAKLDAHIERRNADGVVLTCAADLKIEPIAWLWPGWLAQGKFHLLAGAPGQGKTTIAVSFAATVSAGGIWPDGSRCKPGSVLIWSGEDDPGDTLAPRLLAAGADLARCHFITGTCCDGESRQFDPASDLSALQQRIAAIGDVRLLIVDPVVTAITGDSHKNAETRRGLQPLADLAANAGCAVLGISHFSKAGQGADPANRVIGSVAFVALARVVLVAARVRSEDGTDRRILARGKSNIGPDSGGFAYCLDQIEIRPGIEASRVGWMEAVDGTARELLTEPDDAPGDESGSSLADLIAEELADGRWTPVNDLNTVFAAQGFTKRQVRTACEKLRVERKKSGLHGGWFVAINPQTPAPSPRGETAEDDTKTPEGAEDDVKNNVSSSAPSGVKVSSSRRKKKPAAKEKPPFRPAWDAPGQIEDVPFRLEQPATALREAI